MKSLPLFTAVLFASLAFLQAADAPPAPATPPPSPRKITPGQVIVPADAGMRRIWGELVSLDLTTRTGVFRKEGTDELMNFNVLPYAELLHHAANGDLLDFRIGERAIFRLHANDNGEWTWLSYIQDEMNMMFNHKEYFYVDGIDAEKGQLTCTWANFDKSFIRDKSVLLETDAATRYWKAGQPAKFKDIQVGDRVRTKTHGVGKGKTRMCWEVFLDDESLLKFQAEQRAVHRRRMQEEGLPGYVDESAAGALRLTLFHEGGEALDLLKPGQKVRVARAGVDRRPTAAAVDGVVSARKGVEVTLEIDPAANSAFQATALSRLWIVKD